MGLNVTPLALLGALALLLWGRRADAAAPGEPAELPLPDWAIDPYAGSGEAPGATVEPADGLFPWELYPANPYEDSMTRTLRAFLYAIRRAEHALDDVLSGEDYRTFFGSTPQHPSRFSSYADHPVITGEKQGVPLPDEWCRAAGFEPGCVSTAAGAYQITLPTWRRVRTQAPYLLDFSPENQDEAAVRLINERGAGKLLARGDIAGAVYRVSNIWASLPRSTSKQPQRSIADVMAYYNDGLSRVA